MQTKKKQGSREREEGGEGRKGEKNQGNREK